MINLWKQYDEKLEKTISINHKLIAELQQQKAKTALRPARNYKVITILIGLVYVALISYFWYHLHPIASVFVNVSIAIHLIVIVNASLRHQPPRCAGSIQSCSHPGRSQTRSPSCRLSPGRPWPCRSCRPCRCGGRR